MRERLLKFANDYDQEVDALDYANDEQRTVNNPLIFVFLGDHARDALEVIYKRNSIQWNNNDGVLYFHIHTGRTVTPRDNVFSFHIGDPVTTRKSMRPDLHKRFYKDKSKLMELNTVIRQISNRIAVFGEKYASFQRLSISVVTQIDDPCNILLPEITVLMKTMMSNSFKFVQIDLYGLIKEMQDEDIGLITSHSISFLNEIDRYQERNYTFSALLQVTEDEIRMPAEHTSPLFDIVYLLSDKNEHGVFPSKSMDTNYEMISTMSLLKNRKMVEGHAHKYQAYNNMQFKQNMSSFSADGKVYASAGFAVVKRPNKPIALTVLKQTFQQLHSLLQSETVPDRWEVLTLFRADSASVEKLVQKELSESNFLDNMEALMYTEVPIEQLRSMTLREAEDTLFGDLASNFFRDNVFLPQHAHSSSENNHQWIIDGVKKNVIPTYGLHNVYRWTAEGSESTLIKDVYDQIREVAKQLAEADAQLEDVYRERVDHQAIRFIPLFKSTNRKKIRRLIFHRIYGLKSNKMQLEIKQKILKEIAKEIEVIHKEVKAQLDRMNQLDKMIDEVCRQSVSEANTYLDRNIPEYYNLVVKHIFDELKSKFGPQFYTEDRFDGNIYTLLEVGANELLDRLVDFCNRHIFSTPAFHLNFEEELLERANVAVQYDRKDQVLSKDELYRDLFDTLNKQSAIHIEVYHSTQQHKYSEKYFFGDEQREFMKYAIGIGQGIGSQKSGCAHERRSSGLEKVNIMGGFRIEDLMVYRNGKQLYETYQNEGYEFHITNSFTP